jgi:excisionase family DNA binding protein
MTRLLLRPAEAAEELGVSRSKLYELMRSGQLISVRIGRLRRIPVAALQEYIERLRANEAEELQTQNCAVPW